MMLKSKVTTICALLTALMLASCGQPPQLRVDNAKIVLNPVDSGPSALYFTVHGGASEVKLFSATSDSVIRSEMHESGQDPKTGMMSMEPVTKVKIPAKSKVEFKQGGKHVMMWGVNLKARRTGEAEIQFLFSNGDRILVDAVVEEMDGTVPDERKAVI